jgi:hypothetical protein
MLDRLHARETLMAADIAPIKTLKITVYLNYQGKTVPHYTYTQPLNMEADGAPPMIGDMREACRFINEEIS